jgi:hypothetical protein
MYARHRSEEPSAPAQPAPSIEPDAAHPNGAAKTPRKRSRRPADPPCDTGARHLGNPELQKLLADMRARAAHALPQDAPALESALANLECEAASRGLKLKSEVEEQTPAPLAFHLLLRALATSDRDLAHRALRWVDGGAVFVAWRRIRNHGDRSFRIFCLARILFKLDLALLSFEDAVARQEKLERCGLPDEDLEAYVEQCITSMFAVAFSAPQKEGDR